MVKEWLCLNLVKPLHIVAPCFRVKHEQQRLPIGCPRQAGDLPKIALCWDATVAIRKKHELARGHYVTLGNFFEEDFSEVKI